MGPTVPISTSAVFTSPVTQVGGRCCARDLRRSSLIRQVSAFESLLYNLQVSGASISSQDSAVASVCLDTPEIELRVRFSDSALLSTSVMEEKWSNQLFSEVSSGETPSASADG